MIKKADLTKAGGWTPGCSKCKAMKKGDQSRTNLAHSAECRARFAKILADDVEFRTKMKRANERKVPAMQWSHFQSTDWRQYVVRRCSS